MKTSKSNSKTQKSYKTPSDEMHDEAQGNSIKGTLLKTLAVVVVLSAAAVYGLVIYDRDTTQDNNEAISFSQNSTTTRQDPEGTTRVTLFRDLSAAIPSSWVTQENQDFKPLLEDADFSIYKADESGYMIGVYYNKDEADGITIEELLSFNKDEYFPNAVVLTQRRSIEGEAYPFIEVLYNDSLDGVSVTYLERYTAYGDRILQVQASATTADFEDFLSEALQIFDSIKVGQSEV